MTLSWRAWRQRFRTELRDLVEFVLLPGLAVVMPWPWCFRLFSFVAARWKWLYGAQCTQALVQAKLLGCSGVDDEEWLAKRRLVTLLDHADHYLFRSRSSAWMDRYLDVNGSWGPGDGAALLWTFHWGMGLWALKHARAAGLRAPMVLAAPTGPDFAGRWVFSRYVRARMRSVEMALGEPVIFAPGSMAKIRAALDGGKQLVVVMDVPQDQVSVTRVTTLLDMPVSVPAVLPQLAVQRSLPVTVFYTGVDWRTGGRKLHIANLGVPSDVKTLTDKAFAYLDALLKEAPAAWHLWSEAPRFFVARD